MVRRELRDDQWVRIQHLTIGTAGKPGNPGGDTRLFIDAVLWVARAGGRWRDLPEEFGKWNSVFSRYNNWCRKGVWENIFKTLSVDADFEYILMDSTIVRAHQHSAGAQGSKKKKKVSG